MFKFPSVKLHPVAFSLILAVYFFLCLNLPLLTRLYELADTQKLSTGFIISLPLFLISAFNAMFSPLSNNRIRKPFFITLTVLSAGISYATYNYGVIFSQDMIANVAETNSAEAYSYLNVSFFLWMLCFGMFPAVFIYKTEIIFLPRKKIMLSQVYSTMVSMLLISLIAAFYYQDYAVTLRNNSDLKRIIVPTYAVSSGIKFVNGKYFTTALPYKQLALDATLEKSQHKKLTVFVIGETARAANYSLNGHEHDTNKFTKQFDVSFFKNVTSCGTETSVSVPCMFSNLTRQAYSLKKAKAQDNVLDIIQRAGVETVWIDNNGGCKGVCKNVKNIDIREAYADNKNYCGREGCYDGALVEELKKQMNRLTSNNAVIVLHLMGSHGPAYYKRYPSDMAAFQPDCQRSDIQNCNAQALENTYDNTILYTDKVLADVMKILSANDNKRDSAMLYVSDHGESLGENGLYLHGLPYAIAPEEQKHVPLMTWFSPSSMRSRSLNRQCLAQNAEKNIYSHDNFFHTVMGLVGVSSDAYNKQMDILNACKGHKIARVD